MKILKAIEILDLNIKEAGKKMPPDTLKAVQLGKEGLQSIYNNRQTLNIPLAHSLPGES